MAGFKFYTSKAEISQIARAWIFISLAFAILLNNGVTFNQRFLAYVFVAGGTVGIGFLLHELAHKVVAIRYGCKAEFRSFDVMLIFALLTSFLGVVFAIPGAVFIQGKVSTVKNGIISAVGPLTNMFLAIVFLVFTLLFKSGPLYNIAVYGLMINSWLGLFNLIPMMNLDGTKILAWSKPVYFAMVAFALALMFVPSLVNLAFS